jgi:hypothetical protein
MDKFATQGRQEAPDEREVEGLWSSRTYNLLNDEWVSNRV